jgi:hypothetical protein
LRFALQYGHAPNSEVAAARAALPNVNRSYTGANYAEVAMNAGTSRC